MGAWWFYPYETVNNSSTLQTVNNSPPPNEYVLDHLIKSAEARKRREHDAWVHKRQQFERDYTLATKDFISLLCHEIITMGLNAVEENALSPGGSIVLPDTVQVHNVNSGIVQSLHWGTQLALDSTEHNDEFLSWSQQKDDLDLWCVSASTKTLPKTQVWPATSPSHLFWWNVNQALFKESKTLSKTHCFVVSSTEEGLHLKISFA